MKKFFLLLFLILCTGCNSISYNVSLSNTINENVIVIDKTYNYNDVLDDGFVAYISAFEVFFRNLPYSAGSDGKGTYYAKKEFNSITDYLEQSFVYSKFLDQNSVKINGTKVKMNIKATDELKQKIIKTGVDNLEISLYIPYYVSKHNADKVSNDTYTWIIDDIEKDSIKINFDMSKGTNYKNKIWSVVTVLVFAIIVVLVTIYFVKRNKEANEI